MWRDDVRVDFDPPQHFSLRIKYGSPDTQRRIHKVLFACVHMWFSKCHLDQIDPHDELRLPHNLQTTGRKKGISVVREFFDFTTNVESQLATGPFKQEQAGVVKDTKDTLNVVFSMNYRNRQEGMAHCKFLARLLCEQRSRCPMAAGQDCKQVWGA